MRVLRDCVESPVLSPDPTTSKAPPHLTAELCWRLGDRDICYEYCAVYLKCWVDWSNCEMAGIHESLAPDEVCSHPKQLRWWVLGARRLSPSHLYASWVVRSDNQAGTSRGDSEPVGRRGYHLPGHGNILADPRRVSSVENSVRQYNLCSYP